MIIIGYPWGLRGVFTSFSEIDKRFDDIDKRFDDIDKRFSDIDERFDRIQNKLDRILEHLESQTPKPLPKVADSFQPIVGVTPRILEHVFILNDPEM